MNKAEDKALEKYPVHKSVQYGPLPGASEPSVFDDNEPYRIGFIEGYNQAEKDLELTWEDIPEIFRISEQLKTSWWFRDNEQTKLIGKQPFFEEVLRRFLEQKGNKL